MILNGLFQFGSKKTDSHAAETIKGTSHASSGNGTSRQTMGKLSAGQTIQGEVISKNGNEIQIKVNDEAVITARLEKDLNISVGQNLIFEVKSNSEHQIALRPLYENLAQDANVLKALEAARLPVSVEMIRMVSSMMKEGMPIDISALQDMGRYVMSNSDTAPETIVSLRGFQIPVTTENIQQFQRYLSYEHQILNNVTEVLARLPEAFQSLISEGRPSAAVDFYTRLLQLFSAQPGESAGINGLPVNIRQAFIDQPAPSGALANMSKETAPENTNPQFIPEQEELAAEEALRPPHMGNEHSFRAGGNAAASDALLLGTVDEPGRKELAQLLGELGFSGERMLQVRSGTVSLEQLLCEIYSTITSGAAAGNEGLSALFASRGYNQLLTAHIMQQWLLKPADVAQKHQVENFYERLKEQTARLTEALSHAAKDTPLAKSLAVMQNNIDFMNQINQAFNYIQLPLKMSGGNAHGDLYVYTNRKSAPREDGSVSALLHLDMEHLGTVDIYVTMTENKVGTKFYLKDESTIDFIAEHIHILTERLTERGYAMNAELVVCDKPDAAGQTDAMRPMSMNGKKDDMTPLYSFDVRA